MSPDTVGVRSPGGPSKRMRQSMRKNIIEVPEVPGSTMVDIIQSTTEVGKELEKIIKELL